MSWFDNTEEKLKEWGRKVSRRIMRTAAVVVALTSGEVPIHSVGTADKEEKRFETDKTRLFTDNDKPNNASVFIWDGQSIAGVHDFSKSLTLEGTMFWNDERVWQDVEHKLAQMTWKEMMNAGFVNKDTFKNYQFSAEDFQQMQTGETAQKMNAAYANVRGNPKGKCARGMREAIQRKYKLCLWAERAEMYADIMENSEDFPYLRIGMVKVEGKDKHDVGNIKRMDLLYANSAILVFHGGNKKKCRDAEPAGHVAYLKCRYDKDGKLVTTFGYSDGREDMKPVLENKIDGRYGDMVEVLLPTDTKLSNGMIAYARTLMQGELLRKIENGEPVNMIFLSMLKESEYARFMPQQLKLASEPKVPYRPNATIEERIGIAQEKIAQKNAQENQKVAVTKSAQIRNYNRTIGQSGRG